MTNPIVKIFRSKLNTAVVLLILVLIIGVFGFKIISDFSLARCGLHDRNYRYNS